MRPDFDVIVVGGGPAGLACALVLGRARRRVLVCDHGAYRNAAAHALHGYLTRDGIEPAEFRRLGQEELVPYGVAFCHAEVERIERDADGLLGVHITGGLVRRTRKLLLATGVCDRLPAIDGIQAFYGRSVHHCPYCDGWEWRDRRLAVYGRGEGGAELAHSLKTWSADVMLLTDGAARLRAGPRANLEARGIAVVERRIARLEGEHGLLRCIAFAQGPPLARDALFFSTASDQSCMLGRSLGCRITHQGSLWTDHRQRSNVPDVFVAGDASRDVQFVSVATAEGAAAAVAINRELQQEERRREIEAARTENESVGAASR